MAEETEKKQKYVLHKPKNDSVPAKPANEPEKKKVVVVKKKTAQVGTKPGEKTDAPKVTVKKAESQPAKDSSKTVSQTDVKNEKPRAEKSEGEKTVKTEKTTFELSPSRPNVKMGNLAEKGRGQNRYGDNRGGDNRYGNKNRDGNGGNFNRNNRNGEGRQGGFTGAQAREGYQNRNGENRQGGFNRDKNAQGGNFRRDRNGQGVNGQGGNRGNGQGRPGFGNKQGGQGQRPQGGFGGNRPGFGGRPGFGAAPAPMEEAKKVPAKKTFTKKKTVYSRKDREEELEDKLFTQKKKQQAKLDAVPERIEIMETVSVSDLAKKMNLKAADIIGKLMSMGMMVSITQSIDADTATLLASEYNCDVHVVNLYDETVIASEEDTDEAMESRPPVVTVMGHVDHGKTKTLDAIRSANVVASEFGGITQHIGAYMVDTPKGKITFLDTPGHEAFTMMRARGAAITDIVILVVAADDGVMPQTVEAINHAKDAKVPIVVAVNKVDKPEANPDKVMTQLSEYGLTPEEWGGDTQYVKISALKKEGIDELLEAVLLQAEILELKANGQCRAEGKIIESRIDHGRGVVSTIIVQRGCLKTGDPYVAGIYSGRVRAIFNDRGQKIKEATPSMPVEILGLEAMPNAGDPFQVTETEKEARAISSKRQELKRFEDAKAVKRLLLITYMPQSMTAKLWNLKLLSKLTFKVLPKL